MECKLDPGRTYAVALEGGGARGAYEIGVWEALRENGIRFDTVSGTSVGALNGAMFALGDLEKAKDCWLNITPAQVLHIPPEEEEQVEALLQGRLSSGSGHGFQDIQNAFAQVGSALRNGGLDITPLREWTARVVDAHALKNSPVQLYVTTVNLTDHKNEEVHIQEVPEEEIIDMLIASAYHPAFKQEKLNGKNYADGGFFDTIPVTVLAENGCKDIIAVRLPGIGLERRFVKPQDVNLYTIKTRTPLGQLFNFTAEQAAFDYRIGYLDAMRMLCGLYGNKYYIDLSMSEEEALALLARRGLFKGRSRSLPRYLEMELPSRALLLGNTDKSYKGYLACLLENAAKEKKLDPYRIYPAEELLEAVTG